MSDVLKEAFSRAGEPGSAMFDSAGVRDADALLGALGLADALGAALWRAKYKGDPLAARQAVALMVKRMCTDRRWSLRAAYTRRGATMASRRPEDDVPAPLLQQVAFRVMHEWLADRCTRCRGRGTVGEWGAVMRCRRCGGSRREPPQHAVRAADLGITRDLYHRRWESVFERLLSRLDEFDANVSGVLRGQLSAGTLHPHASTEGDSRRNAA